MKIIDKVKDAPIKILFILLFLVTLFPPFVLRKPDGGGGYFVLNREWGLLFHPPYLTSIDLLTLFVEYILVGFLCCIIFVFTKDKNKS